MYRLRIRQLAEARRLDQSKLSRKANIAIRTVRKLWSNKEDVEAELSTLRKIALALNVKVTDLIEDLDTPSAPHEIREDDSEC